MRPRISRLALLVKVTASTASGDSSQRRTSHAMRRVSTRVLPLPAPASTSSGPGGAVTASRWASLSESKMCASRSWFTAVFPAATVSLPGQSRYHWA